MSLTYQIKTWLSNPSSKFHFDESVQLVEVNFVMAIHKILSERSMKQALFVQTKTRIEFIYTSLAKPTIMFSNSVIFVTLLE